jgi:hypothetical protein
MRGFLRVPGTRITNPMVVLVRRGKVVFAESPLDATETYRPLLRRYLLRLLSPRCVVKLSASSIDGLRTSLY